ncbi:cytochrome p450, putative, partial [Perkinsus marinus ATCC 50983]
FLIAGSDTTAMTVAWCLYYLALYPEIQNSARVEVDALGHDPNTMEDLGKLVFVKCCVLEALR